MKRTYVLAFVMTVGVSLIGVFVSVGAFVFLHSRIQAARGALQDIATEIGTREMARRNARALAQILAARERDIERVQSFFIDRDRPVEFVETLERLATTAGVALEISVDEGVGRDTPLVFRLSVKGARVRVLQYLGLIETVPHAVRVAAFQYQSEVSREDAAGQDSGNVPAVLSILLEVESQT